MLQSGYIDHLNLIIRIDNFLIYSYFKMSYWKYSEI